MARSSAFFTLLIAVINAGVAFAGIGPAATLTISNGNVSPDGFTRAATLTNGKIDGPLITAQKVGEHLHNVEVSLITQFISRGTLSSLTSSTTSTTTLCTRRPPSIGMVSSSTVQLGLMVYVSLHQYISSFASLTSPIRCAARLRHTVPYHEEYFVLVQFPGARPGWHFLVPRPSWSVFTCCPFLIMA
jgi:hypothetical protein